MSGVFLVFEGPDGGGTSTHAELVANRLMREGFDVLHTFEATDGPIGTFIRSALKTGSISLEALQLLFCADRSWHVEQVIRPALEEGKIVICDRFSLSTVIYGSACGLDGQWLKMINDAFLQPAATIFTIPPLNTCMERLEERDKDILESDRDLQQRVYDLYMQYSSQIPHTLTVDTSGDVETTQESIWEYVQPLLPSLAHNFAGASRQ